LLVRHNEIFHPQTVPQRALKDDIPFFVTGNESKPPFVSMLLAKYLYTAAEEHSMQILKCQSKKKIKRLASSKKRSTTTTISCTVYIHNFRKK
jgi:hypothetical protein